MNFREEINDLGETLIGIRKDNKEAYHLSFNKGVDYEDYREIHNRLVGIVKEMRSGDCDIQLVLEFFDMVIHFYGETASWYMNTGNIEKADEVIIDAEGLISGIRIE